MLRAIALAALVATLGCSNKKPASKKEDNKASGPVALRDGPVPVSLAKIDASRLTKLTSIKEFVVIDAKGTINVGKPSEGPAPWAGEPAQRSRPKAGVIELDHDSYAVLSHDSSATAVLLVDSSTPARIMLRDGIQAYGYKPVVLAAGAPTTVVPYQFGAEPWPDFKQHADLTVRADQLQLTGQNPKTVLLQFTDATTTGELLAALTSIAETGAEKVRLHRMMGWGQIPPSDIVWVQGPVADDDEIVAGEPSTVTISDAMVDGDSTRYAVGTAMSDASPRFRYCYEKGQVKKPVSTQLELDIARDGEISNVTAKGLDPAIASCLAGALFDIAVPEDGSRGPAHAVVPISFGHGEVVAQTKEKDNPPKPTTGWWCWIHQAGDVGMCAHEEAQCEAQLAGFNQTARNLGDDPAQSECKLQKTAWLPSFKDAREQPTKALCKAALGAHDHCKEVR